MPSATSQTQMPTIKASDQPLHLVSFINAVSVTGLCFGPAETETNLSFRRVDTWLHLETGSDKLKHRAPPARHEICVAPEKNLYPSQ